MLSVEECRKYLSRKDNELLSDDDIAALRDQMVAWADLAFEVYQQKKKEGKLDKKDKEWERWAQNLP